MNSETCKKKEWLCVIKRDWLCVIKESDYVLKSVLFPVNNSIRHGLSASAHKLLIRRCITQNLNYNPNTHCSSFFYKLNLIIIFQLVAVVVVFTTCYSSFPDFLQIPSIFLQSPPSSWPVPRCAFGLGTLWCIRHLPYLLMPASAYCAHPSSVDSV